MQIILATLVSSSFVLIIHRLGRIQALSFRYTVGWMMLGVLGVLTGVLLPITAPLADQINLSPAGLLGVGAVILLVVLCVQLSISISGMQEQIRRLTEEASYLREELDDIKKSFQPNAK
jgi:hypothetical protein